MRIHLILVAFAALYIVGCTGGGTKPSPSATPSPFVEQTPGPVPTAEPTPGTQSSGFKDIPADMVEKLPPAAAAWMLGKELSLAAIVSAGGGGTGPQYQLAQKLAKRLGLGELAALPETGGIAANVDYLFKTDEATIPKLTKNFGAREAVCFEFAWKAPLIAIMYEPGGDEALQYASQLKEAAAKHSLPEAWKPVVEAIEGKQPGDAVKGKVTKMLTNMQDLLLKEGLGLK